MTVAKKMQAFAEKSSWIRKMFEEGAKLKAEFGAENVFDFSLGNPDVPPPAKLPRFCRTWLQMKSRAFTAICRMVVFPLSVNR